MNNLFTFEDFDEGYYDIVGQIMDCPDYEIKSTAGHKLKEIMYPTLILTDPEKCYAFSRDLSIRYLVGEMEWYKSGSPFVEPISRFSSFWGKLTDDGETVNSNYGYYIWKQPIMGNQNSQWDYCKQALMDTPDSKKAVITIYNSIDHSYKSKDNPCTMNLQFNLRKGKLDLLCNMRSNDIWFGLPYDMPFFCYLLIRMADELGVAPGQYIHRPVSLHAYERDYKKLEELLEKETLMGDRPNPVIPNPLSKEYKIFKDKIMNNQDGIKAAWQASENAFCLKKNVGSAIFKDGDQIASGWSGRSESMEACTKCARRVLDFTDNGSYSIHSEVRAIVNFLRSGEDPDKLKGSTVYVTHGPCDPCINFCIFNGITKMVFDKPYKTDYTKYEGFIQIEDGEGQVFSRGPQNPKSS